MGNDSALRDRLPHVDARHIGLDEDLDAVQHRTGQYRHSARWRRGGVAVGLGLAGVLGLLALALLTSGRNEAVTTVASQPPTIPADTVAAVVEIVEERTQTVPESAVAYETTLGDAVRVADGGTRFADDEDDRDVYLFVFTGTFTDYAARSLSEETLPTGSILLVSLDRDSGEMASWALIHGSVDTHRLGPGRPLDLSS